MATEQEVQCIMNMASEIGGRKFQNERDKNGKELKFRIIDRNTMKLIGDVYNSYEEAENAMKSKNMERLKFGIMQVRYPYK